MAQKPKQNLGGIFSRAEEEQPARKAPEQDPFDEGRIVSAGVGVKEGEMKAFAQLAERFGFSKNAWMRIALRYFIVEIRAGRLNPEDFTEIEPAKAKPKLPR